MPLLAGCHPHNRFRLLFCLRRLQLTKGIGRKQAAAHRAKQKKDDHLDEGEEDAEPIVEHQFDPTGGLGKQRQGEGVWFRASTLTLPHL